MSVVRQHLQNRLTTLLGGSTDLRAGGRLVGSGGTRRGAEVVLGWGLRRGAARSTPSLSRCGLPLPASPVPLSSETFISNALCLHIL